jgi:hypothetical protein
MIVEQEHDGEGLLDVRDDVNIRGWRRDAERWRKHTWLNDNNRRRRHINVV